MDLQTAKHEIEKGVSRKKLTIVLGKCTAFYYGRASSRLKNAKRLVIFKADDSVSLHQNRLVRPVNYMVKAKTSVEKKNNQLIIVSRKKKPKEKLLIVFNEIETVFHTKMEENPDIRLSGSETELIKQLSQDLSMIEKGLKPVKIEMPFRKGVIDILAKDKKGRLVVIEVKRRKASYNAVSQLQRYMKEVENLKGIETRGILLAPGIVKQAAEFLEKLGLEFCKLDFEISGQNTVITGIKKKQSILDEFE